MAGLFDYLMQAEDRPADALMEYYAPSPEIQYSEPGLYNRTPSLGERVYGYADKALSGLFGDDFSNSTLGRRVPGALGTVTDVVVPEAAQVANKVLSGDDFTLDDATNIAIESLAGKAGGLLGTFVGPAAVTSDRLFDAKDALGNRALIDAKEDRDLWDAAQAFVDPVDNKLRFEIDDAESALNAGNLRAGQEVGYPMPLGNYLEHPELEMAYERAGVDPPQLAIQPMPRPGVKGAYSREHRTIGIPPQKTGLHPDLHKTLLHEVQHDLQNVFGFTPGGSPATAPRKIREYLRETSENRGKPGGLEYGSPEQKQLYEQIKNMVQMEVATANDPKALGLLSYMQLGGEAEARLTGPRLAAGYKVPVWRQWPEDSVTSSLGIKGAPRHPYVFYDTDPSKLMPISP